MLYSSSIHCIDCYYVFMWLVAEGWEICTTKRIIIHGALVHANTKFPNNKTNICWQIHLASFDISISSTWMKVRHGKRHQRTPLSIFAARHTYSTYSELNAAAAFGIFFHVPVSAVAAGRGCSFVLLRTYSHPSIRQLWHWFCLADTCRGYLCAAAAPQRAVECATRRKPITKLPTKRHKDGIRYRAQFFTLPIFHPRHPGRADGVAQRYRRIQIYEEL